MIEQIFVYMIQHPLVSIIIIAGLIYLCLGPSEEDMDFGVSFNDDDWKDSDYE